MKPIDSLSLILWAQQKKESKKLRIADITIFTKPIEELIQILGLGEVPSSLYTKAQVFFEQMAQQQIEFIPFFDSRYPSRLLNLPDFPLALYVKGNLQCLNVPDTVAIVGTRSATSEGKQIAFEWGTLAAKENFVVVSGLALGIDTYAHKGCVQAEGLTIAVLAHGLDKVYPPRNKSLAEQIIENKGCLISEYPPGVPVAKRQFVQRNRIQAGLSLGLAVVEAPKESGTMHTIKFARRYKRPIACWNTPHPEHQKLVLSLSQKERIIIVKNTDDFHKFLQQLRLPFYNQSKILFT